MSRRIGSRKAIRAAATYVANATWYACTPMEMGQGTNAILVYATTAVGSAGVIDFKVEISEDYNATAGTGTFFQYDFGDEAPEVIGSVTTAGAETHTTILPVPYPGTWAKVYFRAAAGAGATTLALQGLAIEDTAGSAQNSLAVGDIEVSLENLELAEDSAHVSGDSGIQMLAVRNDTLAALAGTDGDYAPVQVNDVGAVYTELSEIVGTAVNVNGGNRDAGTQTVTLADDDPATVSLAVMDDWDESDRAKVNPIAGQAGIAANAGAMDALTTRVTVATDDTHFGAVGAASDVDGVVHGQLRFIGEELDSVVGTDGAAGPAATVSIGGTHAGGNIQEMAVDTVGQVRGAGGWLKVHGSDILVDFSAAVATSAVLTAGKTYDLCSTEDCYVCATTAAANDATSSDTPIPAWTKVRVTVPTDESTNLYISAIKNAVGGVLHISEVDD